MMTCPEHRDLIEFGYDTLHGTPEVREHLKTCSACLSRLERACTTIKEIAYERPSVDAERRWLRLEGDLDRLDAKSKSATVRRPFREKVGWQSLLDRYRLGAFGIMAATAATVAVFVMPDSGIRDAARGDEHWFQERGSATDPVSGAELAPSVSVFRAPAGADLTRVAPQRVGGEVRADDYLFFVYSNPAAGDDAYRWLSVVGQDTSGRIHWYLPSNPPEIGAAAIPIEPQSLDRDIPKALRTPSVAPGPLTLVFVFSHTAPTKESGEKLVQAVMQGRATRQKDVLVRSQVVEVEPASPSSP